MCNFQIILKGVIESDTNFKHPCAFDDISPALEGLTLSCLDISLAKVVWNLDTFEANFGTTHRFKKYLKESCGLDFDQYFSFKYFREFHLFDRYHQNS